MDSRFRMLAVSAIIGVAGCFTGVLAQQLPSHGAAAAGREPAIVEGSKATGYSHFDWKQDLGVEAVWVPSPEDDRFEDALGIGVNLTFPLSQRAMAVRVGGGFETYKVDGDLGGDDAKVVPVNVSLLVGPASDGPLHVGLEVGLRYNFVDYEDVGGEFSDGLGGVVGLQLATDASGGFGAEIGVGYRFDLVEADNDAGDELDLGGLHLRLALRFSY